MSHRASAWAKPVTHGTTGEPIKVTEKAVLLVLCDYINDECGLAWPGIRRLAREACCAKSTLR